MAKVTAKSMTESGSEDEQSKSVKKSASKNASTMASTTVAEENDEEGGSGDEEEYEIEAILDAKKGAFSGGETGYLVKWKGYEEEHNSWVKETDAVGAKELIEEFWRKTKKNKQEKPKPRTSKAQDSEDESAPTKKRARKSQPKIVDEDEEMEDEAPKKKPRKSTGASAKAAMKRVAAASISEEEDDETTFTDMSKWKNLGDWERLIKSIDTVERANDGTLLVYFTLENGKGHGREPSDICKKKMPLKLIEFYESNLRWKQTDPDAMEE